MKLLQIRALALCLIEVFTISYVKGNSDSLKAILIVGHQEDLTESSIESMNKIGQLLRENGVSVNKFYDSKAEWEEIKKLTGKCSFLIYSGHGSSLGAKGSAGGLCINSLISSSKMVNEFKLKKNALVCFQSVCLGAGSSAGDMEDIGIDSAKGRVRSYSKPFFEMGAAAYYANNYTNGVHQFLEVFFEGKTLKNAFKTSFGTWLNIEIDEEYLGDNNKHIAIGSSPGGGTGTYTTWVNGKKKTKKVTMPKAYDMAYVGRSDFSYSEMRK